MPNYATEAEAQVYFDSRVGSDPWEDASSTDRNKALGHATKIIDRLNFVGCKADSAQENQFPRGTDTTIPQDIKDATSEIALALLDGVDPQLEFENLFMTAQGYGGIRSAFDRSVRQFHLLAGVPSSTAWNFLKPYLRDPLEIGLFRTS
jgi:hypothetical protein